VGHATGKHGGENTEKGRGEYKFEVEKPAKKRAPDGKIFQKSVRGPAKYHYRRKIK